MAIESAAAAIDFAGLIDEAVPNKNGREEFDAASRRSMASMSMKLLLPNASSTRWAGDQPDAVRSVSCNER